MDITQIEQRLEALEKDSHPIKELHEFEVWPELNQRIERLEEWSHPPIAPGGTTELLEIISKLEKRIEALENDRVN